MGQRCVGCLSVVIVFAQVITLEQIEVDGASLLRVVRAQRLEGQAEQTSHPFTAKIFSRRDRVSNSLQSEFRLCRAEVQRQMIGAAAALETLFRLFLIRDKPIQTSANESLKTCLGGIVTREVVLLEGERKKPLREIFGVFVGGLPFDADVFIGRFPIAFDDGGKGTFADVPVRAARGHNRRMVGYRKTISGAADVCVLIHFAAAELTQSPRFAKAWKCRKPEQVARSNWPANLTDSDA